MEGLSLKQAQLLLTTVGMDKEQQHELLLRAGLIATSDEMSAKLVSEALARTSLSEAERHEMLRKLGLMESKSAELILTNKCTEAELRAALARRGYTKAQQDGIIVDKLSNTVRGQSIISWRVLATKIGNATKSLITFLTTNPVGWLASAIAIVGGLIKGYDALIGRQEKLSRENVEVTDKNLSRLDEEITALETLQEKLESARGNKIELTKIYQELNSAIGETKGLLNDEGQAWDIANTKLKANIELKKKQREKEQQDKINESQKIFDNNSFERDWSTDLSASEMRDQAFAYSAAMSRYKSLAKEDPIKKKYETEKEYSDFVLRNLPGGRMSAKEWETYWSDQVDTAYNIFSETISSYKGVGGQSLVKNLINKMVRSGSELSEIEEAVREVMNNSDIQDTVNKYWESLVNPDIDSEKALEAVKKVFDGIVTEYPKLKDFFDDFYNDIISGGSEAANATNQIDDITTAVKTFNKEMDDIQEKFSAVQSAIEDFNENGHLSIDTTQKLLELDDEYLASMVDENGQINLNTIAFEDLARAKIENLKASATESINGWIQKLKEEGMTAEKLAKRYEKVGVAKEFANGSVETGFWSSSHSWVDITDTPEYKAYLAKMKLLDEAEKSIGQGGLGKSDKSGSSKKDNAEKLAEAWKKEHLETLKDGLEEQKDILDRYKKDIDTFDFGLKIVEENDFSTKADLLTDKLDKLTTYGKAMRDEFNRISKITPQTADEAKELASRIETLGSDMRSNVETLRQTYIELQKLRTNMASMFIKEQGEELKSVLSTIDKRIEILKSEYKDEYGYVGNMLSFSSLLPSYSEEDKKLREKRRSDRELIKEEQETQDKINEIVTHSLQMQAEENRKAREKERQKLKADLDKTANIVSDGINNTNDFTKKNPIKIEVDTSAVDDAIRETKEKIEDAFGQNPTTFNTNPYTFNPNVSAFLNKALDMKNVGSLVVPGYKSISSNYGSRKDPITGKNSFHTGIDYAANANTPIYSYARGTVVKAVTSSPKTGYGNYVVINHGNGYQSLYGHATTLLVKEGQNVLAGQPIATVGTTGHSTGNHLHFELRKWDEKQKKYVHVNPSSIFEPFANGTSDGNAMAGSLGIAGENYKPEILIDKATGETTYIDTPTVIDTKKTDVVGEKATAKLPKFEDGTVQDAEDRLITEEKAIQDIYDKLVEEAGKLQRSFILKLHDIENDQTVDDFTKTQNLYKARYDYSTEVTKIGNELYENLSANLLKWLEDVESGSAEWSKEVFDEYKDTLGDIRDFTVSMVDEAVKSIQEKADDRWKLSEDYINERNQYSDWRLFDDSEIEAWERVVEWLRADFPKETKRIRDAEHSLYEAREKEFKKATDLADTYLNSQKTLLQAHYDVVNSVAEAQHDINKELETSKTMYEWLNEDTRKLLFNQEDYNRLNRELNKIQRTANNLQAQYEYDLKNATLEDIEKITSEYEIQYKTLMKSYEIAKADLEIARKKQKLNNVLNERNVRMFINGSWQQVANTEDVITARQELADAEYARRVEASGLVQQRSIDDLTKQQNKLNVTIKNFDNGIISLKEAVDTAAGALKTVPTAMKEMLQNAGVDTGAITSGSTSHSYGGVWYDTETNYMELIRNASTKEEVSEYNTKRNAKIRGEALKSSDIKILTYGDALNEWEKARGYATGTRHTFGGLTKLGEKGFEAYISPNGSLTPITSPMIGNITGGGVVFNTEQLKNLRTLWDWSNIKPSDNKDLFDGVKSQQIDQSQDNRIIINGMTVDTGSSDGQALVNALRRYVGNH